MRLLNLVYFLQILFNFCVAEFVIHQVARQILVVRTHINQSVPRQG